MRCEHRRRDRKQRLFRCGLSLRTPVAISCRMSYPNRNVAYHMSAVNDPYTLDSLSRLCTPCFSIPWSPAPPTWRIGWDGHRTTRVARRLMLSAPRCVTAASCRPVVTFPLSLLPRTAQQELRSGKKPLRKENSRIHQTAETQKLPRWTTAVSLILNQDLRDWYGGVEGYSLFNYG